MNDNPNDLMPYVVFLAVSLFIVAAALPALTRAIRTFVYTRRHRQELRRSRTQHVDTATPAPQQAPTLQEQTAEPESEVATAFAAFDRQIRGLLAELEARDVKSPSEDRPGTTTRPAP